MLDGFSAFGLFEKDGVVSREDLGQVLALCLILFSPAFRQLQNL